MIEYPDASKATVGTLLEPHLILNFATFVAINKHGRRDVWIRTRDDWDEFGSRAARQGSVRARRNAMDLRAIPQRDFLGSDPRHFICLRGQEALLAGRCARTTSLWRSLAFRQDKQVISQALVSATNCVDPIYTLHVSIACLARLWTSNTRSDVGHASRCTQVVRVCSQRSISYPPSSAISCSLPLPPFQFFIMSKGCARDVPIRPAQSRQSNSRAFTMNTYDMGPMITLVEAGSYSY